VIVALVLLAVILVIAVLAPWIAPYDPQLRDWRNRFDSPSLDHFFGTDHTGADVFSKVIFGARTTVSLAFFIVGSAWGIGTLLGLLSAYFGGAVDTLIMRAADVFLALPGLVLAIAIIVILGSGLANVAVAIILLRWTPYARLARAQGLAVRETQYVEAARAIGASHIRIILRHMLPNTMASSIVYASMDLGSVVLLAASLSFLGLGAGPGAAEWGRMISEGRSFFFQSPWIVAAPGGAILLTVLSFSLLGDGLRDIFDPRTRRGTLLN
jgi:peptide/nickel transport system permease protein